MARPLLCVTVTAPTMSELRRERDAVRDADLVELRLDGVADPDVVGALAGRKHPVIVTCRPVWEGGSFDGSEEDRIAMLTAGLEGGAEYVDVEWKANHEDLLKRTSGRRIVLSNHDFVSLPADLADRARAMRGSGAEVVKLAAKANRLSDCVALRQLGKSLSADGASVVIGMGDRGTITRAMPGRFGSLWTYAGSLGAVGQIDAPTLLQQYRFQSIGEHTELYGLTGSPIAHSVSPAMHNAAFRAMDMDAVYLPFPAADADDFVTFARAFDVKGASVTIPFKVPLYERVDETYAVAQQIGAINTIRACNGRWIGVNTDVDGFIRPLEDRGITLRGMRAAVLGSGGSARSVTIGLARAGASVTVHARNAQRAGEVAAVASAQSAAWPPAPGSWDMLVNCTPIGMHPHVDASPVPAESLSGRLVYDLVYNPPVTRLLRDAAGAGCVTIGGLDMLVAQAEEQCHLWTGVRPPDGVMRRAALERLAEFVEQ